MALIHLEGFENGNPIGTYLTRKYPSSVGSAWATGRFGGKSCQFDSGELLIFQLGATPQTVTTGFASWNHFYATGKRMCSFYDGGTLQMELQYGYGGSIRVLRGTTVIGESAYGILKQERWQYIEFKCKIDNAAGTYEVQVDGVSVLSASGVDTQQSGSSQVTVVYFFPPTTNAGHYIDDIYICDDTGSYNTTFLGDVRIVTAKPNSDGTTQDFTIFPDGGETSYQDVDDGTTPDDNSTYVESATDTNKEQWGYETLSSTGSVYGVEVFSDTIETAGTYTITHVVRSGGTDYDDTPQAATGSYLIYSRIMDTDPDTSAPWTLSNLNSAEFGVKVGV